MSKKENVRTMAVERLDNVGIVVESLDVAISFAEIGLELEGRATIEGDWAERVTGLRPHACRGCNDAHAGRPQPARVLAIPHAIHHRRSPERSRGRAIPFGNAQHYGDMSATPLNGPVIASAPTQSGRGYWMIGSDGGVFSFVTRASTAPRATSG